MDSGPVGFFLLFSFDITLSNMRVMITEAINRLATDL